MKTFLLSVFFVIPVINYAQQKSKPLSLQCNIPSSLKKNQQVELMVNIDNKLTEEKTGNITMDLFNYKTNSAVDGWFLNVFPYQYFTAVPKKRFTAKFPFTVPGNYTGKLKIVLKASCNNYVDSLVKVINIL